MVQASIYDALKYLQYEGTITLKEEEVNAAVAQAGVTNSNGVGCVLNFLESRDEWINMRALITQVTEDVTSGSTTISFGPAAHLGVGDLVELLRMTRTRVNYTAPSARSNPEAGARGELGLGKHLPQGQASSGAQTHSQFWVVDGTKSLQFDSSGSSPKMEIKDGTKTVGVDPSTAPSWATDIKLRSCKLCLNNKQMLITGEFSLAYDPETGKKYDPATGTEVP